jgi:hypothetical protein
MSFSGSLRRNGNKALLDVNTKCYAIARELFTSIVSLSPSPAIGSLWSEGLLVNQWYPKNGQGFSSEYTAVTSDYGAGSLSRVAQFNGLEFKGRDGAVTFANNSHYAYQAEAIGWDRTKPYRMVAKSLQKIGAKYK